MAFEAQAADQPGVVALPLVKNASGHDLPRDVPAGWLAYADERVVIAPEDRIDRGNRMYAVGNQQIPGRADRSIPRRPALEDTLDRERSFINHLVNPERPPHRDVFTIAIDCFERRVEVKVYARLGNRGPGS